MRRALAATALLVALARVAAADDDVTSRKIVFARGDRLVQSDGRGKTETELATLPGKVSVRALRTDAKGTVLIADLDGTWSWMPLDGSVKTLTALPCQTGPAQLASDGTYVLCRAKGTSGSLVVNLRSGKQTPLDVPTTGARLVGAGDQLRVVWADGTGVWSAVPPQKKSPTRVAPQAPLRSFLVSPDGAHAVGVFADEVYESVHKKTPAEVLMVFPLDASGARRKVIKSGVPIEWSQDSRWVLVQNGTSACIMLAVGGQYKCWRGYTAAALSPDGKYALVFGSRDLPAPAPAAKSAKSSPRSPKSPNSKTARGKAAPKRRAPEPAPEPEAEPEEPTEAPADDASDDVPVAPPGGPVALYRAELSGAFTKSPTLVTRDVAGAAVWIP